MDNLSKKKKVKKPKMARKPRTKKATDRKPTQLVNVNVTSSGGGGSGGASIPSAQPLSNAFLNQSSQAEREANRGLLNRLDQLLKKQDDINPLVKSLEKKPDSIEIKEKIVEKLNDEDEAQGEVVAGLNNSIFESINSSLEAERVAYESLGGLTSEGEKEQKRRLRDQIKELGGNASNAESLQSLKNKLSSLQSMKL
jgi:hypothetical protein